MNDFRAFLESLGIVPPPVIARDGKIHRCRTVDKPRRRNGAFMLSMDGRMGWGQNHATMGEVAMWRAGDDASVPAFDPRKLDDARLQARRERRAAIEAVRRFWRLSHPLRNGHAYLESHGLDMTGCSELRVDRDGWLVVPAYRGSALMTVQRIAPDGKKLYWKHAPKMGAVFVIERRSPMLSVAVEGLATGLAIYAAVPGSRVVVGFDTAGLLAAAEALPHGRIVVASDNDLLTICDEHRAEGRTIAQDPRAADYAGCQCNPGVRAALAASSAVGAGIAVPPVDGTSSDWCDLRNDRVTQRLTAWNRRPHVTDLAIRRAVDAELAHEILKAAEFKAPTMEMV